MPTRQSNPRCQCPPSTRFTQWLPKPPKLLRPQLHSSSTSCLDIPRCMPHPSMGVGATAAVEEAMAATRGRRRIRTPTTTTTGVTGPTPRRPRGVKGCACAHARRAHYPDYPLIARRSSPCLLNICFLLLLVSFCSRANRMLSNRESARRSRRRKQEHLGKLEYEVRCRTCSDTRTIPFHAAIASTGT